jgi:capsular polysaccharide biosynthesis protein
MEVVTYIKILGRYWWLVLLAALASTGVAAAISFTKAPTYAVQARVVAKPAIGVLTDTNHLINTVSEMSMRSVIGTLAQIFTSAEVQQDARRAAGLNDASAKDYPLQANVLPDTTVIEVSARGPDPQVLTTFANSTIDSAVARAPGLFGVIELQPLERAVLPLAPTSPVPARDIPIGGGLGLALGVLLAFAIEYMRAPRRAEYERQILSLIPNGVPTITSLTQVPSLQQPMAREDVKMIDGPIPPRQEYLVPGQEPRVGWHRKPHNQPERALQPSRKDDAFPG